MICYWYGINVYNNETIKNHRNTAILFVYVHCTVHCTLYSVHCTLYCTLYSVYCTSHTKSTLLFADFSYHHHIGFDLYTKSRLYIYL